MIRSILASAGILTLLAAPVVASEGVTIHRWPEIPQGPVEPGSLVISIAFNDGSQWRVVDGLSIQPDWGPPVCAPLMKGAT